MVDLSFEIGVVCEKCGNKLSAEYENGLLSVEPCEKCLNDADNEGYTRGYDEGIEEGSDG